MNQKLFPQIRFIDLFAGIGGFSLGLERSGMVCVGQVENNKFCLSKLNKHWPHVKKIKDIKNVKGNEFGPVELICGGFPCQPFSLSGKRCGKKDDRYLWPEMLTVIQAVRPNWIIGENVPGITSMALDTVLSDLEAEGYTCQTFNIPACAQNAPHRRQRIWILAHSGRRNERQCCNSESIDNEPQRKKESADKACGPGGNDGKKNLAHPESEHSDGLKDNAGDMPQRKEVSQSGNGSWKNNVANTKKSSRERQTPGQQQGEAGRRNTQSNISNAMRTAPQRHRKNSGEVYANTKPEGSNECNCQKWWSVEPGMGRVADGIPHRVDRLKALGNAVVPQIPEVFGNMILEIEKQFLNSDYYDNSPGINTV